MTKSSSAAKSPEAQANLRAGEPRAATRLRHKHLLGIAEMTPDGFFESLTPDGNLPIALGKGGCFARLCVQKKNR